MYAELSASCATTYMTARTNQRAHVKLSERTESIIASHDWLTQERPPADPIESAYWMSSTPDASGNRHRAGATDRT